MRKLIVLLAAVGTLLLIPVVFPQITDLTKIAPHKFAEISKVDTKMADGAITYCADCRVPVNPGDKCEVGGPGAEAHRIRGNWVCF